jgi:hypothetical protein
MHVPFDCIALILSFINVKEVGVKTLLNIEESCSRIQSEMQELWIVWYKHASYEEYCNLEIWFSHTDSFKYRSWKRELLVSQRRKQEYIVLNEQPKIKRTKFKGPHMKRIAIVGNCGAGKSTLFVQYSQVCISVVLSHYLLWISISLWKSMIQHLMIHIALVKL